MAHPGNGTERPIPKPGKAIAQRAMAFVFGREEGDEDHEEVEHLSGRFPRGSLVLAIGRVPGG